MSVFKRKMALYLARSFIACFVFLSAGAFSQEGGGLDGTWVLDTKATEDEVLKAQPPGTGNEFMFATHFHSIQVFEFVGDLLFVRGYVDVGEKIQMRQVDDREGTKRYSGLNNKVPLEIEVKRDGLHNISIHYAGMKESKLLRWKRAVLDPKKSRPEDFSAELKAIFAMYENISKALPAR
jgi:hypothetical protein